MGGVVGVGEQPSRVEVGSSCLGYSSARSRAPTISHRLAKRSSSSTLMRAMPATSIACGSTSTPQTVPSGTSHETSLFVTSACALAVRAAAECVAVADGIGVKAGGAADSESIDGMGALEAASQERADLRDRRLLQRTRYLQALTVQFHVRRMFVPPSLSVWTELSQ